MVGGLKAGEIVMTGSFTRQFPIAPGDRIETVFSGLGSVQRRCHGDRFSLHRPRQQVRSAPFLKEVAHPLIGQPHSLPPDDGYLDFYANLHRYPWQEVAMLCHLSLLE